MTCECREPQESCDVCAIVALANAAQAQTGVFTDDGLNKAARQLVRYWLNRREQHDTQAAVLTVGCSHCGSPAGRWCVTSSGNVNDDKYGPAYFHAARRRALAELDTPTAEVIELFSRGS